MTRLPIDENYLLGQLKALLDIDSPTGYTDSAVHYCSRELERLGLKPELTRRGAIRAIRRGDRPDGARAVVAHLDTLGAQVKRIKDNGRLTLAPIGHWSARFAEGARVTVYTETDGYRGTILPLKASGHTYNDEVDTQPTGWHFVELRIDAITASRAETEALGIAIGDIVAIDPNPEFSESGFINSRFLDDKAGAALMLAAIKAVQEADAATPVDIHWLFTIAEEVGVGASSVVAPEVASLVAIDNGTVAPEQNSSEFGVTIAMADMVGPFDYHLTKRLVELCRENGIPFQKDVFRYYRSDSASAIEAGHDIRTALITFGVDASHGYERVHVDALRCIAELVTAYVASPLEIARDVKDLSDVKGFTRQPTAKPVTKDSAGRLAAMIWFTSDTHFADRRVLLIDRRPFASLAEHDAALIGFWNDTVAGEDEIWHLGDFTRGGPPGYAGELLATLHGRKHLIIGNNDDEATVSASGWASVQHYKEMVLEGQLLILCHYPFRTWNKIGKKSVNLHGHSHGRLKPVTRQYDVGVDAWNFRPVMLETILMPRRAARKIVPQRAD